MSNTEHVKRLLFIVNDPAFFASHRLPVAIAAMNNGFEVHVATGPGETSRLAKLDIQHHFVPLSRSGKNPFAEMYSLWSLFILMRRIKPDVVHLVTIKPVLYGGIVARIAKVPGVVAAISGLGAVFIAHTLKARLLRHFITILYKLALRYKNSRVIFQNPDDCSVLVELGAVQPGQTVLIKGSGVALSDYPVAHEPEEVPVIVFASRLLKDKGVEEFVKAAKILKERGVKAQFRLIGSPDPGNPATVAESELDEWRHNDVVEVLGYREDMPYLFAQSNIVVLPSYREGLPKVLIEAAASGRAVITTNVPGCRDAIEPGVTGLLVPVRDPVALAKAIEQLVKDSDLRKRMGRAGRALAEREFSIEKVVKAHLKIYRDVLKLSEECSHN